MDETMDHAEIVSASNPVGNGAFTSGTESRPDVLGISQSILSQHQGAEPPKRKRGRPPGRATTPSGSPGPAAFGTTPQQVSVAPPSPPVDPKVIVDAIGALCKMVDKVVSTRVENACLRIKPDDPDMAREISSEMRMTEEEGKLIPQLAGQVCVQYNLAGQHAPAILLVIVSAGWMIRMWIGFGRLDRLARMKAALDATDSRKSQASRDG